MACERSRKVQSRSLTREGAKERETKQNWGEKEKKLNEKKKREEKRRSEGRKRLNLENGSVGCGADWTNARPSVAISALCLLQRSEARSSPADLSSGTIHWRTRRRESCPGPCSTRPSSIPRYTHRSPYVPIFDYLRTKLWSRRRAPRCTLVTSNWCFLRNVWSRCIFLLLHFFSVFFVFCFFFSFPAASVEYANCARVRTFAGRRSPATWLTRG